MFNIKYLEYFIVSADMGSFSKAAAILYTTQSNVSKGVRILEEYVGDQLFVRQAKGIALTPQGKHVYKYASQIMEDMDALRDLTKNGEEKWIHIATNPSSWVADRFVDFYDLHRQEDLHWQIFTASVEHIMRRMADYKDERIYIGGEFGIGLNSYSKCLGNCYIEDESAYGTFHIGLGRNLALGGKQNANGHFDLVCLEPDIYTDNRQIMQQGKIIIPEPAVY